MIKVPRDLTYPPKIKQKSGKKNRQKKEKYEQKKCAVPKVKKIAKKDSKPKLQNT